MRFSEYKEECLDNKINPAISLGDVSAPSAKICLILKLYFSILKRKMKSSHLTNSRINLAKTKLTIPPWNSSVFSLSRFRCYYLQHQDHVVAGGGSNVLSFILRKEVEQGQ